MNCNFGGQLLFILGATLLGKPTGAFLSEQIRWQPVASNIDRIIDQKLNISNPMELALWQDDIFLIERTGTLKSYNQRTKHFSNICRFEVCVDGEDGLIGLTLDPCFETNHWIYLARSLPDSHVNTDGRPDGILRVARFQLVNNVLDPATEQVIIDVQAQREAPRHPAGSLCFDCEGNLLVSLGDNTEWNETLGYSPLDERPGRGFRDAQRTAANPNSLLGKILRLRIKKGGGYEIPAGNLFPPGTIGTRPEIFVMGVRNPFRITWDHQGEHLWWCDLGPDASMSSKDRGPAGYDEINCTRKGGFFGWPYFIANNKPYPHFNFETRKSSQFWSDTKPSNLSINNNGLSILPEARGAQIYYGHSPSTRWTNLNGVMATCAIMGPIYHYDSNLVSDVKLPKSLDNCVFIADWARNWLVAAKLDQYGELAQVTDGQQQVVTILKSGLLRKPIDLELGQDGALYILEYGSYWVNGPDARISRLIGVSGLNPKAESAIGQSNRVE